MSKQEKQTIFTQDVETTYAALKTAVEKLRYTVTSVDDAAHTLNLSSRVSGFSWGENITAIVTPAEGGGSALNLFSEPKLKTNVVDMGRGKRILEQIAHAVDAELNGGAAPQQSAAPQQPAATGADSVADELRKFAALRDEGILTDEEFAAKKKQILGI